MEKKKWSEKVTNEKVLERTGEKRTLLNTILLRKLNWICHIQRRNCILRDTTEGLKTEVKSEERRRTQLLDGLRNRGRYRELKEGTED